MPFAASVVNPIHQRFDQKDAKPTDGPFVNPGPDVRIVSGQRIEGGARIDDLGGQLPAIADYRKDDLAAGAMLEDVGHQFLQRKDEGFADLLAKVTLLRERLQSTTDLA